MRMRNPEEIELVIRVKVEGMEELDAILERVKAIKEYADYIPAHMHINNNITVEKSYIDGLVRNGLHFISPDQQRLEV